MTVYVDDMLRPAKVAGARRANWSHLFADTPRELREFAQRLGLRLEWVQHAGTHREHFDVTATVRARALDLGAEPITYPRGVADLMMERRTVCQCRSLPECTWPRPAERMGELPMVAVLSRRQVDGLDSALLELEEAALEAVRAARLHEDATGSGA